RETLMGEGHDFAPSHRWQHATGQVLHWRVLVVAEPDAADQVSGEGVEPGIGRVVGRPGLARDDETRNLGGAAGALGHDMSHDIVHFGDLVRREHAYCRPAVPFARV